MSNWWKRFFGLDEEERFDENEPIYKPSYMKSQLPTAKGRFEDPGRHIEVKMVNQYPLSHTGVKQNREQPSSHRVSPAPRKVSADKWDEPAYTRLSQRPTRSKTVESRSDRNNHSERRTRVSSTYPDRKKQEYKGNGEPEAPKRKPFRPTTVPSPIYGYQERKIIKSSFEEPQFTQPEVEIEVFHQADEDLEPVAAVQEIHVDHTEDLSTGFDGWTEEPDVFSYEAEEENTVQNEELSQTVELTPIEDEMKNIQPEPAPSEPKNPSVPYNVLMYGADRHALRKLKEREFQTAQPQVSPPAYQNEHDKAGFESNKARHHEESKPPNHQTLHREETPKPLPVDLFQDPPRDLQDDSAWISEKREILQQVLKNFHVRADIVTHIQGPTVTRFEIRLHPGVKVSKVVGLTEDIKLSMAAEQIRIAPVAGKSTVGIEIPNEKRKPVYLKKLLQSEAFKEGSSPLTAALGIDISGREVVTDLSKMPHGLIAGATGSGKSVCIHSLILSLIYKSDPDALRLVLIDPKVVELSMYQRLPHLAAPVINQPKDAALALRWAVEEMERRYQAFADIGVRDIKKYNQTVEPGEKWPYIVIIIDELADLMMVSPQDVEESICRIAQKARAAGIHLLLATQRPSVDVITGLIKANIPTRIAFGVSAAADSRTILDSGGAERLLGQGDMLFAENGSRDIQRLQGAFVSDDEIDRVTDFFASWPAPPHLFDPTELREQRQLADDEEDELYEEAAHFVIDQGQASVSSLQRRFRIGYNRAARLIDTLEAHEVISESNGSKPRQVLVTKEVFAGEDY